MSSKEMAELIMHPVRLRIIEALFGPESGRMTAGELSVRLGDVPPATLYRHIKRLLEAGMLQVVEERPVRGVIEKVYALAETSEFYRSGNPSEFTDADHSRYFMSYITGIIAEFNRYLRQPGHNLIADGVGFSIAPMYLSDAEFMEVTRGLYEVLRGPLANPPAPNRRRRSLYTIVIPDSPAAGAAPDTVPPAPDPAK